MENPSTTAIVENLVREAEDYRDERSKDNIRAIEYYDGKMTDTPADQGKSQVISRDVRAMVKKVLPSVIRTILGNDEVVEYIPGGEGDEEDTQQASDYINFVVFPEADGYSAIHDALHDALLLRNGIVKWWYSEKINIRVSKHSGLLEDQYAELVADDDTDVLEHSERTETVQAPEGMQVIPVHDLKIKRRVKERKAMLAAVAPERFLIHPDAVDLDNSPLVGEKTVLRRSDLVAMGYDKDVIDALPIGEDDTDYGDAEREARKDESADRTELAKALQPVDYYDLYVRVDADEDGIAELRHMCFAGGLGENNLLLDEECDEVQFADIKVMRRPHQWEGISLADDVAEIQRVKTVLLRQTLDNIYWQNNLQPLMQEGAIVNPEAVFNPSFGLPIRVSAGLDVRSAIGYNNVPFVARDSFSMLEYMDNEATDRTGVSDASSGLAPDALQNMTAKASAMVEQAGIGQTELMVRTAAQGLKRVFRGLLRLIVRHQDVPRTVRLRDEWVSFDPRHWNAEMDATVNTGLGAGTRERDMLVMQQVMSIQEKLLAGFGPDNPFVKPENVYAATSKLVEAAGLRTPSLYFTEPNPEEIAAKFEAMKNQPNPEQMKIDAQMKMEEVKLQAQTQLKQAELQANMMMADKDKEVQANKELAQMEADKEIEAARRETDMMLKAEEIALAREKMAHDRDMKMAELSLQREIAMMQGEISLAQSAQRQQQEAMTNDAF